MNEEQFQSQFAEDDEEKAERKRDKKVQKCFDALAAKIYIPTGLKTKEVKRYLAEDNEDGSWEKATHILDFLGYERRGNRTDVSNIIQQYFKL